MNLQFDAERVRALRDRLGLTQQQFADRLGVTQPAVTGWESGQHQPTGAPILEKLIALERETEQEAPA